MTMTYLPMIALATILILAVGSAGWYVLTHWKKSSAHGEQVPPEVPTRQWLRREARNAKAAKSQQP
jgi:hypothetical protein